MQRRGGCSQRAELVVVARPRGLRGAALRAAAALYAEAIVRRPRALLLDLPRGLEAFIKLGLPAEGVLERGVQSALLPSSPSVLSSIGPVVSAAVRLAREVGVEVVCYAEAAELAEERRLASEAARLTLRASIRGLRDADLAEWMDLLEGYVEHGSRSMGRAVDAVALAALQAGSSLCLAGMEGWELAKRLRRLGVEAELRVVGLPYLYTPLEVASRLKLMGRLGPRELRALVEEHIEYIRNYVMRCRDLDEAYEEWLRSKAPWLLSFSPLQASWRWARA
ncbi:MAG: hypothetical protein QXT74_02300 [Candidatus Nezhaarchaeales archaeon]